uniref:U3 small nucleolar RNA-associated protein 14 homolog A n=1 Tax=Glossina brevipalpis TaxID=37001 RepID=A0A1A9WHZ3_9MUSC
MSDEEEQINHKAHKQLLHAVSGLGKTQHIRKSTRNEPQQHGEFQLVKGVASISEKELHPVDVGDIVKILKGKEKHIEAGKELKNVTNAKKVLNKPLEKPAAGRIKRSIGYENVKKKLARWDAVVTKNRAEETQIFPLRYDTIYANTSAKGELKLALKSDLMLQMEDTENKLKAIMHQNEGDLEEQEKREQLLLQKKMTRGELIAKRKELAYLKLRESQKSAKARLQNKIKSKKYHKLTKRQRLQEQIKQFELLQKTNPEAALEKLDALEKSRALERASLRHKNAGSWAKNLQIRAKYDKDVRKDLSEQLQMSRELTHKKHDVSEGEEEEENEQQTGYSAVEAETNDPFNPWTKVGGKLKDLPKEEEEKMHWRKYWLERNDNTKMLEEYKKLLQEDPEQRNLQKPVKESSLINSPKDLKEIKQTFKNSNKPKRKPLKTATMENGWLVEEVDPSVKISLDDIFDAEEDRIREKLSKGLKNLSEESKHMGEIKPIKKNTKKVSDALENLKELTFTANNKKPIIDEELQAEDTEDKSTFSGKIESIEQVLIEKKSKEDEVSSDYPTIKDSIDPTKVATIKLNQHLKDFNTVNEIIDDVNIDESEKEDDPNNDRQITIAEAFEDDDIIADFSKEKADNSTLKNADIVLTMPGWGRWAGAGISKEQAAKRNKRLILKLAPNEKRRDENKNNVYINEEASKHLRNHLVSDVSFPFTSLKDYENSIRAPVGRNLVTETAFRLLTRPAVITRKGQIIDPMDDSELVKRPRKFTNPVDIRISKMSK